MHDKQDARLAQNTRKVVITMRIAPEDISRLSRDAQQQIAASMAADIVRKHKYHNEPTEIDGIHFDSRKEADRFKQLLGLQRAGMIRGLKLQPEFTLQEAFTTIEGERQAAIRYRADFSYYRIERHKLDGRGQMYTSETFVIEDVKSEATRKNKAYRMKAKMMAEKGMPVTEVL